MQHDSSNARAVLAVKERIVLNERWKRRRRGQGVFKIWALARLIAFSSGLKVTHLEEANLFIEFELFWTVRNVIRLRGFSRFPMGSCVDLFKRRYSRFILQNEITLNMRDLLRSTIYFVFNLINCTDAIFYEVGLKHIQF